MKFKHLIIYSAIFTTLGLSGCGGSDSTAVTATPVSTAFAVNVQVPDGLSTSVVTTASLFDFGGFFISEAAAATVSNDLGAGNFKVAIVDAAGVVTEIVTPESIAQETDGTWIITLAGGARVDCVIIADISKTPDVTIGQTLPSDAIYAPTASEQFDIDIRSTTAFQEFIEAVADNLDLTTASGFTEAEVTALVEKAQELPLPTYTIGQTLEQYLAVAIPELEALVEREIIVINNTDTTFNLATYVENDGGINWYWSEGSEYERGRLSYDVSTDVTTDLQESFDGTNWIQRTLGGVDGLILTDLGWTAREDQNTVTLNADGSVTLTDATATAYQETLSAVKVDVSGQQIKLFIPELSNELASTATFSTGAEAHLLSFSHAADIYEVWADDSSGAVTAYERRDGNFNVITNLNDMFSAIASTSTDATQMNVVRNGPVLIELIGSGTSGTANLFIVDEFSAPNDTVPAGTTTWERRTVNGKDIVLVAATGNPLQDEEGESGFYLLTVYPDNYSGAPAVVEGWLSPAGSAGDDTEYVFNDIAAGDINGNFDPNLLTCNYSSPWDDLAGQPATFNSYDDFLEVLADCGGALPLAAADLEGNTFAETFDNGFGVEVEAITYNADGTFDFVDTLDGTVTGADSGNWSVANNLLTLTTLAGDFIDVSAVIGINHQLAYTEEATWTNNPDITVSNPSVAEGEIWHGFFVPVASSLSCATESGWVDTADGGLGAPITPYSFADFETVVTACGGALSTTRADVAGSVFVDLTETTTYNDGAAAATEADPETGNFSDSATSESIDFLWYIEATTGYLVVYSDSTIDIDLPAGFEFRETTAVTGISGTTLDLVHYSEQSNYSVDNMVRSTGADGEIWSSTQTPQ